MTAHASTVEPDNKENGKRYAEPVFVTFADVSITTGKA